MAQFQDTHRREDTVPRRKLNREDISFLTNLQKELNTQDDMGNADPRFWVIRQTEEFPVPDDFGGELAFIDESGATVAHDVRALLKHADNGGLIWRYEGAGYWCIGAGKDEETLYSIQDILDFLKNHGLGEYTAMHVEARGVNVQDTLFLTHKACEDHLRQYGYNYGDDAHAFAMTATRSPEFERLIKLLQSVNWAELNI